MAKKKVVKKKPTAEKTAEVPFEESLAEIEEIVTDLESGELGLSESLTRYEQGVRHIKRCQTQLDAAERRIELLSGVDAQGNPITEPFDAEASTDLEAKAQSRATKRSTPTTRKLPPGGVDDVNRLF